MPRRWICPIVPRIQHAPIELQDLPAIDVVLITHDHYDHLEAGTMRYLADKAARFIAPLGVGARLQSWGVAAEKITELGWGDGTQVGGVRFIAEEALHYSARWRHDRNKTLWAAFVLEGAGKRIYWSGDSGYGQHLAETGAKYGVTIPVLDDAPVPKYLHIAACTGNASEDTMRRVYNLPEIALIEMGDFVGAVLKHLRKVPVDKLSLCGGFGKISKLAAGHMDLHSRHSSIDLPQLADWAAAIGADAALQTAIRQANTSQQALAMAHAAGIALGDAVCQHALNFARSVVPTQVQVEVFAIDRQGGIVGHAGAFE